MRHLQVPLTLAMLVLPAACSRPGGSHGDDSGNGAGDGSPQPPSVATLTVDLSVTDGGLNLDAPLDAEAFAAFTTAPATHHLQASSVVMVVNSSLAEALVLPVVLLRDAADAPGMQDGDGTWTRSYDTHLTGRNWTVNLVAKPRAAGGAAWSLRVTSRPEDVQGCCRDFELAAGETAVDGSGTWQIYDVTHPTPVQKLFTVTFAVEAADKKTLSFQMDGGRSPAQRFGRGSIFSYKVSGDAVNVTLRDSSEQGARTLYWSRSTQAGSHTDPQGRTVCWEGRDKGFADVACK